MAAGNCKYCGKPCKNPSAHERFCKDNPDVQKKMLEKAEQETEEINEPVAPLPGELEPDDIQEQPEPQQDHMFRIDYGPLDPFGKPYRAVTQARLKSLDEAWKMARTETNFITMEMTTTPYGPCGIRIPKKDVDSGVRSLAPFTGNIKTLITENGETFWEILITRSEIRKMYFMQHSIIAKFGFARYEDIQRNALTISPEGSATAPPPMLFKSQYEGGNYDEKIKGVAKTLEED